MSEMVERVRAALQKHQAAFGPDYEGMARAAIEAMREPSEGMVEAGLVMVDACTDNWTAKASCIPEHVFPAMINAALK